MEKILIILRGLPGSGKSSFAELLGTKAICCADDYVTRNGIYNWKPETIGASHDWSQRKCRRFMKAQVERIVVANTSTSARELKPYMDLARQFGYKVFSVVVENRHGGVNVHNVPDATLEKMKERLITNIEL
jgi:predicted kinase